MLTATERETNAIDTENAIGPVSPGLCGTCPECQSAYGMEPREFFHAIHVSHTVHEEGGFSWQDCDLCGSSLGGDRYAAHATQLPRAYPTPGKPGGLTHLDVCADCLLATANGEPYPDER